MDRKVGANYSAGAVGVVMVRYTGEGRAVQTRRQAPDQREDHIGQNQYL